METMDMKILVKEVELHRKSMDKKIIIGKNGVKEINEEDLA